MFNFFPVNCPPFKVQTLEENYIYIYIYIFFFYLFIYYLLFFYLQLFSSCKGHLLLKIA